MLDDNSDVIPQEDVEGEDGISDIQDTENNSKEPGAQEQEGSEKEYQDDGKDPEIRNNKRSVADFVAERRGRKLAKMQQGQNGAGEEEEEPDEEDVSTVTKIVSPLLDPLVQENAQAKDNQAINDFLSTNPDFKQFEGKVRRYMAHDSRKNIPVPTIFMEVAGIDFIRKSGARQNQEAIEAAAEGRSGGGDGAPTTRKTGADDIWGMPQDEFEKKFMQH